MDNVESFVDNLLREGAEERRARMVAIPAELKRLGWVVWRREPRLDSKKQPVLDDQGNVQMVKMPYLARTLLAAIQRGDAEAPHASASDPSTWTTFEDAWEVVERVTRTSFSADTLIGAGPVLTTDKRVVCIDLDHVLSENHPLRQFTASLIERLGSFAEVSQSGEGVHIFVYADLPEDVANGHKKGGIEVYGNKRYVAMTGNTRALSAVGIDRPSTRVVEATEDVLALIAASETRVRLDALMNPATGAGKKLLKLWNGDCSDYQNDHSRADLALCGLLGHLTDYDTQQIDLLFRMSRLYREKWDELRGEHTYGENTIAKIVGEHEQRVKERAQLAGRLGLEDVTLLTDAELSEAGYAKCFAQMFAGRLLYNVTDKRWMEYHGGIWQTNLNEHVGMEYAEQVIAARKDAARTLDDKDARDALMASAIAQNSAYHQSAIAKMAANKLSVETKAFDAQDEWVVAANGMAIHLPTGATRPATPEDRFSKCLGAAYDPDATCPRWKQFIDEVFGGNMAVMAYVQTALGYSMTLSVEEQAMFVCVGLGANGKSMLLNTVAATLGTYRGNASFETLESGMNGSTGSEQLAMLAGKRYVTMIESNEGKRLNEAKVKLVTAGDTVTAAKKYGHHFDFRFVGKIWLATNRKPRIIGTDKGIWRRIHLIEFTQTFEGAAADKKLERKLEAEASGILNWLLEGCQRYHAEGLERPAEVVDATQQYREESDVIATWLDECAVLDPNEKCLTDDAYASYKSWSERMGEYTLGRNIWLERMAEHGFERKKLRVKTAIGSSDTVARWHLVGFRASPDIKL